MTEHISPHFDFNIHLPPLTGVDVASRIDAESQLDAAGVVDSLRSHAKHLDHLLGANLMLFNQSLFKQPVDMAGVHDAADRLFQAWAITALLPFRDPEIETILNNMERFGVRGVKFHSYVQQICIEDFEQAIHAAQLAESRGFWICIDASYGTTGMYRYDNLRLAAAIADAVRNVPIIILHSGGLRTLEAMLIALQCPNVLLETSFSLHFYQGSRVAEDLAFAYRQLGADRLLYASDHPYVDISTNEMLHQEFFAQLGFDAAEYDKVFRTNALQLFNSSVDVGNLY